MHGPAAPPLQQLSSLSLPFWSTVRSAESVPPEARGALRAMAALTRCCGKLEVLDRVLAKLWVGGHRVLVFCTMTKALDVLEEYLEARAQVFAHHYSTEEEAVGAGGTLWEWVLWHRRQWEWEQVA